MARDLDLQLRAGMIASWQYERITFRLAYRQYHRTDFVIGHLDRSVELRQVKGWHKNLRAGIKGLKWAAKLFPMFTWTLARWNGQAFDVETVTV